MDELGLIQLTRLVDGRIFVRDAEGHLLEDWAARWTTLTPRW
jgi:hypothetical protein